MNDRYQYLILMGLCVLVTLPLEFVFHARVYRRPRRLLAAMAVPVGLFAAWDVIAIARGTWGYSRRYTTGWLLPFDLPVEELVFFVVIPICGLLSLEAVRWMLTRGGRASRPRSEPAALLAVVILELAVLRTGLFRTAAYWIAMAINLFFMVLVDGWLTKLSAPIVLYAPEEKTPWRFPWDIPVEDFAFGIALLTLVMLLWDRAGRRDATGSGGAADRRRRPARR